MTRSISLYEERIFVRFSFEIEFVMECLDQVSVKIDFLMD